MRKWKKFLTSALTTVLLFGLSANSAMAAGGEISGAAGESVSAGDVSSGDAASGKLPYTYTVTFYAGNQGEFDSTEGLSVSNTAAIVTQTADKIVVSGLALGDEVGLTAQSVIELDAISKYYVKGIRLSGRDNDTVAASGFSVDGDTDYVVAYGIKGNQVSYTVKYQDANGNTMAPDEIFYGNVGDKPVIAYKYIEGYAPKYLGVTKTLSENAAENVFIFVYEPVPTNIYNEVVTEEVIERVETIVVPGGNGGTGPGGNTAGGNAGTEDTDTEEGIGEEGTGTEGTEGTEDGTGDDETDEGDDDDREILDLDDEETPLAKPDNDGDKTAKALQFAGYVGLALAAVAALFAIFLLAKRRVKETPDEQ